VVNRDRRGDEAVLAFERWMTEMAAHAVASPATSARAPSPRQAPFPGPARHAAVKPRGALNTAKLNRACIAHSRTRRTRRIGTLSRDRQKA
jgi:hypothetical protein